MKALDEIYIFSFAPFQISVIKMFQDFCTMFAKFEAMFVDFQRRRHILLLFVKCSPVFFGISQNFSDFDRSDAKIAIFQRNVKTSLFGCGRRLVSGG